MMWARTPQRQTAVIALLENKQLLLFAFRIAAFPANMKRSPNAGLMLAHRLRLLLFDKVILIISEKNVSQA